MDDRYWKYLSSALEGVVKTLIQITIMTSKISLVSHAEIWLKSPNALSIRVWVAGDKTMPREDVVEMVIQITIITL